MAPSVLALLLGLLPSGEPLRFDRDHDPLPCGALARVGSYRGREPEGRHHLAAYCPARNLLATAGFDSQVRLYDATTGQRLAGLAIEDQAVYALAFSADGQKLAVAGSTQIVLVDLLTRDRPRRLEGWPCTVSRLLFSPDGRCLVALETREGVRIWETETGKVRDYWKTPGRRLYQATFSRDGRTLAVLTSGETAADQTQVRFWEFASGVESTPIPADPEARSFALWPEGRRVAVLTSKRTLAVVDTEGLRHVPMEMSLPVDCPDEVLLTVAPDGRTLVAADRLTNSFWDLGTGAVRQTRAAAAALPSPPALLTFSSDGQTLRTWRLGDRLRTWDREGKELLRYEGPEQAIRSLQLTSNGREVISTDIENGERFWDAATLRESATLRKSLPRAVIRSQPEGNEQELGRSCCTVRAFSSDGALLAHAYKGESDEEQGLEIWDVGQKARILNLELPKANIRGLAFAPDGLSLAVAGQPWGVALLEVATGQVRRTFSGHVGPVNAVLFSADGRRLFTGGADWTILVWEVHPFAGSASDKPLDLWNDLVSEDAALAFRIASRMIHYPRQSLPLLREQVAALRPAAPTVFVEQLIARLASDHFNQREQAAGALLRGGTRARKEIVRALEARPALDLERQLRRLLEDIDGGGTTEELRQLRVVEVLEQIGVSGARHVLTMLTDESAPGRVSVAARAALRRLNDTRGTP